VLQSEPWLIAKEGTALADGTSAPRVAEVANKSVEIGLAIALIISLIEITRETYRWQSRRKVASADSGAAHVVR
jgi:hypothetical protein